MARRFYSAIQLIALPIVLIAAWWFGSASSTSVFFPPLTTSLKALADWIPEGFRNDIVPSVVNLLAGYGFAVVAGIGIGILLGRIRTLELIFAPLIEFARSIPPVVLLPFFILAMGPTDRMRILVITVGSVWPTLLATVDGIRGIDPGILDVTRIYRVSPIRKLFKVYLPAASPLILAGMKTSLAFSIILIVVSEMLASTRGIGFFILSSQQYFDLPNLWAGTIVMGVLGYLLSEILLAVERKLLAWKANA